MATVSGTFRVHPGGGAGSGRIIAKVGNRSYEHSITGGITATGTDPILTAIADEFDANGTLVGTVTITAA